MELIGTGARCLLLVHVELEDALAFESSSSSTSTVSGSPTARFLFHLLPSRPHASSNSPLVLLLQRCSPHDRAMLPKVANQILHHTSRAVAAVQNQTGQTIRSVLQLQSSSGPSSAAGNIGAWNTTGSSSSGWGSGPGAGGAKHQSSSRFHGSYSVSCALYSRAPLDICVYAGFD